MGDRRRRARDVHAGGLRVPRDRLLARQERRHRGREDPDELLDRRARYWAVGFAFAFGGRATSSARTGSSCATSAIRRRPSRSWASSDATIEAKWFFQFVFCAVSLAIVWGTTLERIKFGVYAIYAVVFAALIYPIGSHWVFGGGWLQANLGMQDFAGSTAVHLIGATGALAVLLHLGPRRGKYGADGKPRAIPGHNMPLFGLGDPDPLARLVRLQPGLDARRARRPLHRGRRRHAARGLRRRAVGDRHGEAARRRRSTSAWRATARSPRSSPSRAARATSCPGPRSSSARSPASSSCVGVLRDRQEARRPGRRALGARPGRHLGHARVRPVHQPGPGRVQRGRRRGGLVYTGSFHQLGVQALGVVIVFAFVFVAQLHHLLGDQEDLRPARQRRGGGRRPRHLRARHVRLPGAVHPGAELVGVRSGPDPGRRVRVAGLTTPTEVPA